MKEKNGLPTSGTESGFPKNFLWGAGTSAFQVEGACCEEGKGESVWDRFSHIPGNIKTGETADIGCDHYHRFEEDIRLAGSLGIQALRISVSWSRVCPDGFSLNNRALQHYREVLGTMRKYSVVPVVTLEHWDIPQRLMEHGGWVNRETVESYVRYAQVVFNALDEYAPLWVTHNEPYVTASGYWPGTVMAPRIEDPSQALLAAHHLLLSHGRAVRSYREHGGEGKIGIVLNLNSAFPSSALPEDVVAAERFDGALNRWFLDPLFLGRYPQDMCDWYGGYGVDLPEMYSADMRDIMQPMDFLGVNYYKDDEIAFDRQAWPLFTRIVPPVADESGRMGNGWKISHDGLRSILLRLWERYPVPQIIVTENGAPFSDDVREVDGSIADDERIAYLQDNIAQVAEAIRSGVNISGYFVWSLLDGFEWTDGYSLKFGLIEVRRNDLTRVVKKSGKWYGNFIRCVSQPKGGIIAASHGRI